MRPMYGDIIKPNILLLTVFSRGSSEPKQQG